MKHDLYDDTSILSVEEARELLRVNHVRWGSFYGSVTMNKVRGAAFVWNLMTHMGQYSCLISRHGQYIVIRRLTENGQLPDPMELVIPDEEPNAEAPEPTSQTS